MSITKFKEVVQVGFQPWTCSIRRHSHNTQATVMFDTQDFGLHVPIDAMMSQLDKDASGTVDFKEFQTLLE